MALFMDVHDIEGGVSAADVAAAHAQGPGDPGQVRGQLPAVLGQRGGGEDLLPRRGRLAPTTPRPCTARRTGWWPTRSTRWRRDEARDGAGRRDRRPRALSPCSATRGVDTATAATTAGRPPPHAPPADGPTDHGHDDARPRPRRGDARHRRRSRTSRRPRRPATPARWTPSAASRTRPGRHGRALHRRGAAGRHRRHHRAGGAGVRARRRRPHRRPRRPRVHRPGRRLDVERDRRAVRHGASTSTRRCRCGCCTPGCGRTTRPASSRTGTRPCACARSACRSSARTCRRR